MRRSGGERNRGARLEGLGLDLLISCGCGYSGSYFVGGGDIEGVWPSTNNNAFCRCDSEKGARGAREGIFGPRSIE